MHIKQLKLHNIGPFLDVELNLLDDPNTPPPVILITGENGTGKSILVDAIRGIFGSQFCTLERDLRRSGTSEHSVEIQLTYGSLRSQKINETSIEAYGGPRISERLQLPESLARTRNADLCPNWVVDYWPSTLASGQSYKIDALNNIDHFGFLQGALQGSHPKSNITQLICHFDYLRDSREPKEKEMAEHLYQTLEQIVQLCLLDGGKLSHVARATYEPIVLQNGQEVSLSSLSSGNLYLLQHLIGLLRKMYAVHFLRKTPIDEIGKTPGFLLIDEAENQLHPKWQKKFIQNILKVFPNLQIIATTHSPFIISSVSNARLFVCKSQQDHCIVVDETAEYANKPVDEILMSPLFEETSPFNQEITELISAHKRAIKNKDTAAQNELEKRLKSLNPSYFSYLDVENLLGEVLGRTS